MTSLQDRFRGCLIGQAVGDALGALFEGQWPEHIHERVKSTRKLMRYTKDDLWYTDDTQMAIGIAETLAEHRQIIEPKLCEAFVANYNPSRGYGMGARKVLDAMEDGRDYRAVAERHFPGGSFGNGAAMRVAPVGLFFRQDVKLVIEQARLSALPTHLHPLGIEGAQLLAIAIAYAARSEEFDRAEFFDELLENCQSDDYREKLEAAIEIDDAADLGTLGNGIEAIESVPTAIASFALTPHSYEETIGNVILLGGDTDTMAAMAGALSGAYLGLSAVPKHLVAQLEDTVKGRSYILELADKLHGAGEGG